MKLSRMQMLIPVLAIAMTMSACGRKNDDSATSVTAARGARSGDASGLTGMSTQNYTQGQAFVVSNDPNFSEIVKVLASATVNPQEIGVTDNQRGVVLAGVVRYNPNTGTLVPTNSMLILEITDSNVSGDIPPILIKVPATQLQANGNNVQLTFADSYGSIRIVGAVSGNTFSGSVSFQNNQAGYMGQTSGTLGTFNIPFNSFFTSY
ncbi:MAG: hypothetical protein COT73_03485 [Bdellovibrio sp. CG10_big_fil_rev_8_21_14_0_10_47_8]|nr:MAG: hypothetical protein COT73_03485 [Bdellovibrio sp. CG10_big_fil_rev_8_21_14_0_10_47_8]